MTLITETKIKIDWTTKSILVVEDEYINYYFIAEVLKDTNVHLLWAKDGQQAVQLVESDNTINLILMDIKKFSVFINCFSPNPKNGKIILNDKDYSQHEILPFAYKFKEYIVDKFNKSHKSKYDKFIKQRFKFEKGNINHISAIRGRETKDDKLKCLIDEIFEKSTHKE